MTAPIDSNESLPRAPGGEALMHGRQLTYREARSWLKRADVVLGRWRGTTIEWASDEERSSLVMWMRRIEGKDCDPSGDVVLYRLSGGQPVLVVGQ